MEYTKEWARLFLHKPNENLQIKKRNGNMDVSINNPSNFIPVCDYCLVCGIKRRNKTSTWESKQRFLENGCNKKTYSGNSSSIIRVHSSGDVAVGNS